MSNGGAERRRGGSPAIDRYLRALRAAGVPDRGVVVREEDIEGVAAAVTPFVIPDDLVDAWLRVGPMDWLIDAGEFQSPQSAFESWGSMAAPQGWPRAMHSLLGPQSLSVRHPLQMHTSARAAGSGAPGAQA